jgi:hypothetical protein
MTAYIKVDGAWVATTRPYIKRNNVWTPAKEVYVKRDGAYATTYQYDTTPPNPPELTLEIIQNRYIRVGIRIPGGANASSIKMVRVLASKTGFPTTPFGDGYITGNDTNWPKENWSNWWYVPSPEGSNHGDTSDYDYKKYPLNPTDNTNLPGGQYYYFAAWASDTEDNWSVGTFSRIWMPKEGVKADKVVLKEMRAQANAAGSLNLNGVTFTPGDLVAQDSPRSNGVWYHAAKFTDSVGAQGTPTIKSAQIRISRANDSGQPTAQVNLYWHDKTGTTDLPLHGTQQFDATNIGTLNKGETKWFDIPAAWYPKFNTQIKGFGLRYGTQASDYIVAKGLASDMRCGEVHLVWEEAL